MMSMIICFLYHPPQPTEKMSFVTEKFCKVQVLNLIKYLKEDFCLACYEKRITNEPHDALGLFQNFSVCLVVSEELKKFLPASEIFKIPCTLGVFTLWIR